MMSFLPKFSQRSIEFLRILAYMVSILACFVLLLNPLAGIIEPIPDLLPGIGNLDEVAEVYFIYWAWPKLEASIREYRKPAPTDEAHRLEEIDYIDVKAEILPADTKAKAGRKTKTKPASSN